MRSHDTLRNNLFARLFSYTPREGRKPIEDFCTETLAWCLLESPTFRQHFLSLIDRKRDWGEVDIATQYSYRTANGEEDAKADSDAGRFDLLITTRETPMLAVVIESKVDASFGFQQISRYKSSPALKKFQEAKVITLTPSFEKPPDAEGADDHIPWAQVQKLLEEQTSEEPCVPILKQFAVFLKNRGLYPMKLTSLTQELKQGIQNAVPLIVELQNILEALRANAEISGNKLKPTWELDKIHERSSFGYYSSGSPMFWVGFVFEREEVLLWVELYLEGDCHGLKNEIIGNLKLDFDLLPRYLRQDEKDYYVNSSSNLNSEKKVFGFVHLLDSELNGNPDSILSWFQNTIKEAKKMAAVKI